MLKYWVNLNQSKTSSALSCCQVIQIGTSLIILYSNLKSIFFFCLYNVIHLTLFHIFISVCTLSCIYAHKYTWSFFAKRKLYALLQHIINWVFQKCYNVLLPTNYAKWYNFSIDLVFSHTENFRFLRSSWLSTRSQVFLNILILLSRYAKLFPLFCCDLWIYFSTTYFLCGSI